MSELILKGVIYMTSLLEKSINFGLGLFALSREKIEKIVEELVDRGEVAREDAQKMVKDLVKKGEEQKEELRKMIKDAVAETLGYMNVAKKEDIVTREEIKSIVREEVRKVLEEMQNTEK
ncbi:MULTISPECIES: phasin family protein [Thermoanaerobacteraceae]|nr:hypothetical protein [Caldanaerobacter subterraneus]MDI3519137.1 hypothetical protein [Caldanaerobacter sp.]TCO63603.1 polyhydroxyalkanoate synthesis regulator phasin [Caldanaerobacter subterraneus]